MTTAAEPAPTRTDPAPANITVDEDGAFRAASPLNEWSADGRMLTLAEDAPLKVRPLPLPMLYQDRLNDGHTGARLGLSKVDRLWREDDMVVMEGTFDMADPEAADLARKVREGYVRFISLDVDMATAQQVCIGPDGEPLPDCDPADGNAEMGMLYTDWRAMGATLLAHPAYPDAIMVALAASAARHRTFQEVAPAAPVEGVAPDEGQLPGWDPEWGCVTPTEDGTGWEQIDCEAEGAVQANEQGDGPFDPEEVADSDTVPTEEEQVEDNGNGCVAPDPDNEDQWVPADCEAEGAVPANADQTGPAEDVTDAANEADDETDSMATGGEATVFADTDLPWAPREREWDGSAAADRVEAWATSEGADSFDPDRMERAFLVVDGPAENKGSYKFGVADIVDDELRLVWNGVVAAAAALSGARAEPAISNDEMASANRQIRALYRSAAEAFDDPSIMELEGAEESSNQAYAPRPYPESPELDEDNLAAEDAGNGCVCPHGTAPNGWLPCDCDLPDARTAGPDGTPVEMTALPADCEPCTAAVVIASSGTPAAPGFTPPAHYFANPELTAPAPITVDPETGQLSGHLAAWGTCHVGYPDRCITPPRSASGYSYFHTARIPTSEGALDVGIITMDTGHAPMEMTASSTVSHYDNTGTQAAVVRVGEDAYGIWVAGVTLPFVSAEERLRLSMASFSGDWRHIRGGAELVAALAVNTPGFPMPARRTTADNAEYALVAAGALTPPASSRSSHDKATKVDLDPQQVATIVLNELDARDTRQRRFSQVTDAMRELGDSARKARASFARSKVAKLEEEIPSSIKALKSDLAVTERPDFQNWVEQQGGLPRKIRSVADALMRKGMGESQAIATAVNVARKGCGSGDTNWPGRQQINARSRAEYCAAIARWEQMKAAARAS